MISCWTQVYVNKYRSSTKCPLTRKLEDTKGMIRSHKSNDKQHNDQKIPKE
jgi:hypothetical protein